MGVSDMAIVWEMATAPEHGEHFGFSHLPVNKIAGGIRPTIDEALSCRFHLR